jgi:LysM repeat protein
VGQVLSVHVPETVWATYTVRAGDSLGAIGRRHGCSVADLQAWNSLQTTVIHPGQTLKIRR